MISNPDPDDPLHPEFMQRLGEFVVAFSAFEAMIEGLLLYVASTPSTSSDVQVLIAGERGPEIGRTWASLHHILSNRLRCGDVDLQKHLKALNTEARTLIEHRNKYVHGTWIWKGYKVTPSDVILKRRRPGASSDEADVSPADLEALATQLGDCASGISHLVEEVIAASDAPPGPPYDPEVRRRYARDVIARYQLEFQHGRSRVVLRV